MTARAPALAAVLALATSLGSGYHRALTVR
jgi:hypothetical protein